MLRGMRSSLRQSFNKPPQTSVDASRAVSPQHSPTEALEIPVLSGDTSYLRRVIALSDGAHIVAGGDMNQLHVYSSCGDRLCELPHPPGHRGHYEDFVRGLVDLGGGLFLTSNICNADGSILRTWRAPATEAIGSILVADERIYSACCVDESTFAVGLSGDLVFYSHRNGTAMEQLPRLRASLIHSKTIYDIASHDSRIVTASNDRTAVVWDWKACSPIIVLHAEHPVICCAMDEKSVVLGTRTTLRVYDARMKYGCTNFIDHAHDKSVMGCMLLGSFILSMSLDGTVVASDRDTGLTTTRVGLRLPGYDFDVLRAPDGEGEMGKNPPRIVVVGLGEGVIFQTPLPQVNSLQSHRSKQAAVSATASVSRTVLEPIDGKNY